MISTDFAPNESWDDALLSLKTLFMPWLWKNGNALQAVKKIIGKQFSDHTPYLFLSGRSGLFHTLQSLSLPIGAEIIVQAFTCEAVILPIIANKLKPVYADIEAQTFSLDPVALESKISDRTKVVILQHTFGLTPIHRAKIQSIIKEHKLLLIEDIAHGVQRSKIKDQRSKNIFLMSFGRSKAISSVFGGAIITNILSLQTKLTGVERKLTYPSFGFILRLLLYKPLSFLIKSSYDLYIGKLIHKFIRLINILPQEITSKEKRGEYDILLDKAYPNALALLLLHQFEKYEQLQKHRALICDIYRKKISNFPYRVNKFLGFPLLRYPLLVKDPEFLKQTSSKKKIFLGSWYNQVIAPKSINFSKMNYVLGSCPIAEDVCKHIINLPTNVSYQEALKIISNVKFQISN